MTVGSIGQASSYSPLAGKGELDAYDRQIKELQQKVKDTRSNDKLDDQQKNELIQQYQNQITELTTQRQQRQMEMVREQANQPAEKAEAARENRKEKAEPAEEKGAPVIVDESLARSFISAQTAQDSAQALGQARAVKEGELRIASSTSYLRGEPDAQEVEQLLGELANIQTKQIGSLSGAAEDMADTKPGIQVDTEEEDPALEPQGSGTGRMEPGQYLDDEA